MYTQSQHFKQRSFFQNEYFRNSLGNVTWLFFACRDAGGCRFDQVNNGTSGDDHVANITSGADSGREQKEIRTKPPMKCQSRTDVGQSWDVTIPADAVGPHVFTPGVHITNMN